MLYKLADYFDAFGGPKSPQWGGMIQVAHQRLVTKKMLKNESSCIVVDLGSSRRSHHPDHGGVNGSSNKYRMKKIWLVKVLVDFCSLGRLNGDTIWKFSSRWNLANFGQILGEIVTLLNNFLRSKF